MDGVKSAKKLNSAKYEVRKMIIRLIVWRSLMTLTRITSVEQRECKLN